MHSVIFAGISLINQIVQKWGNGLNWHEKMENRGESFGKIWGKSPKVPNSINAQDLKITQGGFFPQKQ